MGKARCIILLKNFDIFFSNHTCCYPVRVPVDLVAYTCRNGVVALVFLLFTGIAAGDF